PRHRLRIPVTQLVGERRTAALGGGGRERRRREGDRRRRPRRFVARTGRPHRRGERGGRGRAAPGARGPAGRGRRRPLTPGGVRRSDAIAAWRRRSQNPVLVILVTS